MKVINPDSFLVEFTDEELTSICKTADIFRAICGEMKRRKCDTLGGSADESGVEFDYNHLLDVSTYLHDFCTSTPTEMF